MQCRYCESTTIQKNGKRRGKQNYKCVSCGCQFIDVYSLPKGYPDEVKKECLKLYLEGMGFRAIERNKGVHHTNYNHLGQTNWRATSRRTSSPGDTRSGNLRARNLCRFKKTNFGSGQQ